MLMSDFFVGINKEKMQIDGGSLFDLLEIDPSVKEYARKFIKDNTIAFTELKDIAERANIPYPLFFAPRDKIRKQIEDYRKNIENKFPAKDEITLSHRGVLQMNEAQLIVRDLARRQEFLKKYLITDAQDNGYIGYLQKEFKKGQSDEDLAKILREYFDIKLSHVRTMSKERGLVYICNKIEEKGIFISLSSHNYMPQNLGKDVEFSGMCVKDKKFPFIFINTRDGDETPLILETAGRQIFTVISMLVSIGMNIFAISNKKGSIKNPQYKKIFSITGATLIPKDDLVGVNVKDVEELKQYSGNFKVTPSMLLVRLEQLDLIDKNTARDCRIALARELTQKSSQKRSPLPVNGYGKYNGTRFSGEVLRAYHAKKITSEQVKNILFRKGKKMNNELLSAYTRKFQST